VEQCRLPVAGACWAYIGSEIEFFLYGFYPLAETWRVNIFFLLLAVLLIPLLVPRAPFKLANAILFFVVFPIFSVIILLGGWFGLRFVPTESWGGLMVTLIVSIVGICCSLPLGIVFALGRRSKLPVIKTLCVAFIELIRAVPLISVLFMASIMLPLFMPQGTTVDKFLRALVGVALFSAAYMAEVVRGGLQAIPRGQYEAASALGLSYWKAMAFIILPQALKHVIPGIVNNFISLFKDTSLVYIVGMKDLLDAVKTKNDTALEWQSGQTATTGYAFAAMVFWVFCFGMSRYSIWMERRLHTGHKR
jgi:general L-amino acid transport system permease protein